MTSNPYAPPTTPLQPIPQWSDLCVDGHCLVVRDGVTLPLRCVFTNESITSSALREYIFDATPSFRLVLRRYQYRVFYGLSSRLRFQKFRRGMITASLFVICLLIPALGMHRFQFLSMSLLVPFFMMLLFMLGLPRHQTLRVVKSEHERVWLEGCCPEFLAFVRQEYGTINTHAAQPDGDFKA